MKSKLYNDILLLLKIKDCAERIKNSWNKGNELYFQYNLDDLSSLLLEYHDDDLFELDQKLIFTSLEKFQKMASTDQPFGLFEPKLWKDKIGDSLWHCAMNSVGGNIVETTGSTMEEAIDLCFEKIMEKE